MSKLFLKVKFASLSEEAKVIRREELKLKKWKYKAKLAKDQARERTANRRYNHDLRDQLYRHRIDIVRPEARAAHLAMGYLRGVPYRAMEKLAFGPPLWSKVWHNVVRFGGVEDTDENRADFVAWADVDHKEWPSNYFNPRDYAGQMREKPSWWMRNLKA